MGSCCHSKNREYIYSAARRPFGLTSTRKLVNNLKLSIFCGTKGFLIFNLAALSWLEYTLHNNKKPKGGTTFAIKRNIIPFCEMVTIPLFVCFALQIKVGHASFACCALICAALMITTCLIVRTFHLRELLLVKWTKCSRQKIDEQLKKDTIKYPIFDQNRKHIVYNSPDQSEFLDEGTFSLVKGSFKIFFIKPLQSCIMLSLAIVELLEAMISFCVDLIFNRDFLSTKSNIQRSSHLLYASIRNLVPITRFDSCIANLIGTPQATCCSI